MPEEYRIPQLSKPIQGYRVRFYDGGDRIRFFHMTEEERDVAYHFIRSGVLVGDWYCDIRLPSKKASWLLEFREPYRRMWENLLSKRIDLLCVQSDAIHIIEVKRLMLSSGVGQLLTYYHMFIREYLPTVPVYMWYATFYPDPDVKEICEIYDIRTWTYIESEKG